MADRKLPGFRFYPTEEELLSFYLPNKLEGKGDELNRAIERTVPVLDIYQFNPSDLPRFAGEMCPEDSEQWFFFIPRQESEAQGRRPRRLTTSGFWKATGSPGYVYSSTNRVIGLRRTMVFYNGRAPKGKKTEWKMNEYKAIQGDATPTLRQEFSLCRIYKKSKCLRAFDRRPMGVALQERKPKPPIAETQTQKEKATTSDQSHPIQAEKTTSHESSSSGDHVQPGESSHTEMKIDDNLWDWDQANWFFH